MNQPTTKQFEELKKRVERLEQQQTEPIKVTRIEIDNHTEILKQLSTEQNSQSDLLQTIFTMVGTQGTDIAVLKTEMQCARADITSIKATQSDHGELLKEHGEILREHSKHFDKLETIMLQILDRLPQPEGE